MKAVYNTTSKELIIKGEKIQDFKVIVPKDQEKDYWNTVKDRAGNYIYDINLYIYEKERYLQYVNLIDDGGGGLECGDDYKSIELITI